LGYNYTLGVTTDFVDEETERLMTEKIENVLIKKMESRDLGLHVDFLKDVEINDLNLLKAFAKILDEEIAPKKILSLSISRDGKTLTTLGGGEHA